MRRAEVIKPESTKKVVRVYAGAPHSTRLELPQLFATGKVSKGNDMSQHGPTLSPDLIYLPFWKIKQGWEQDRAEYEERVRRREEREYLRFIRTPEGAAWLKAVKEREEERAYREEMQARNADHAKRVQAVLQKGRRQGF